MKKMTLLRPPKWLTKCNPITKKELLAKRFVVRIACSPWSVRIKTRKILKGVELKNTSFLKFFSLKMKSKRVKVLSLGS